jgi:DNA gyrase subunit A
VTGVQTCALPIYEELLVVTQNGYGKRTSVGEYKVQTRGGKGLLTYDKAKFKKTGELIGAMVVNDNDEILLINSDGIIIRIKAGEVSRLGRATQGVKIMRVAEDANIITMAKVIKEDEEDGDEAEDEVDGNEKSEEEEATQITLDTE